MHCCVNIPLFNPTKGNAIVRSNNFQLTYQCSCEHQELAQKYPLNSLFSFEPFKRKMIRNICSSQCPWLNEVFLTLHLLCLREIFPSMRRAQWIFNRVKTPNQYHPLVPNTIYMQICKRAKGKVRVDSIRLIAMVIDSLVTSLIIFRRIITYK